MDARILILIVDLQAAFVDRGFRSGLALDLARQHRIAVAAERDREIARGLRAGVEMLVEHAVRRREDKAVLPFMPLEVLVAFLPHPRVAGTIDREDVRAGTAAVALLVGTDRHLRDV